MKSKSGSRRNHRVLRPFLIGRWSVILLLLFAGVLQHLQLKACLSSLQLGRSSSSFQYRSKFQGFFYSAFQIFSGIFVRLREEISAFTRLGALSERMVSSKTREAKLVVSNYFCSLCGCFLSKHRASPQRVFLFASYTIRRHVFGFRFPMVC